MGEVPAGRWYSHTPGTSGPKHSNVPHWRLRSSIGQSPLALLAHQSYCTLYCATTWPSITQTPKQEVAQPAYYGLYVRLDSALNSQSHDLASAVGSLYWLAL